VADAPKEEATTPAAPSGLDLVKAEADKAYGQGFIGEKVDPNPNEVYTIAGVIAAKKS
jgi:hypothetical protein